MNLASPPPPAGVGSKFRKDIGLSGEDFLVLQPTRAVQRKGIETSVELIGRLDDPRYELLITYTAGGEGDASAKRARDYAALLGIEIIFAEEWIGDERHVTGDPGKKYTI
jgi:hypothetical protein